MKGLKPAVIQDRRKFILLGTKVPGGSGGRPYPWLKPGAIIFWALKRPFLKYKPVQSNVEHLFLKYKPVQSNGEHLFLKYKPVQSNGEHLFLKNNLFKVMERLPAVSLRPLRFFAPFASGCLPLVISYSPRPAVRCTAAPLRRCVRLFTVGYSLRPAVRCFSLRVTD